MSKNNPIIHRMLSRKGGRRRVPKGFAKTLDSELARELVNRRWEKYYEEKAKTNNTGSDTEQKE